MTGPWWNWPNNLTIPWPSDEMDFSGNHLLWALLPVVFLILLLLFTIFFGKKYFPMIPKRVLNWTLTIMGFIAISWELWFDIASIASGVDPLEQFKGGFDLCRLNMYLLGVFLLLRRIEWVKWIAATCLFGGMSTMVDHFHDAAQVHSLITHGIILSLFPSIAIAITRENYKFRNYIHAHILNYSITAFLIITNFYWGTHAGELAPENMHDNVLVGWAFGGDEINWPNAIPSMAVWIGAVMFVEASYFLVHRSIYWFIYQKDQKISWVQSFKNEWPKDKAEWYGFRWNKARVELVKSKIVSQFNKIENLFKRDNKININKQITNEGEKK